MSVPVPVMKSDFMNVPLKSCAYLNTGTQLREKYGDEASRMKLGEQI